MKHFVNKGSDVKALQVSSAMNITPMIDVLLVLLVIFMQALPLSQRGIDITLPSEVRDAKQQHDDTAQVVLNISAEKRLSINSVEIPIDQLDGRIRDLYSTRRDKTIWIMGAGTLRYGDVVEMMDVAKGAGVERIGIITEGMQRNTGKP